MRFDKALEAAIRVTGETVPILAPNGESVLLVRDLTGRFRVFVDREPPVLSEAQSFEEKFAAAVGAYAASGRLLYWRDILLAPHLLHDSPDAWNPVDVPANLRVVDRLVTGREWLMDPAANRPPTPPRFVFFGLKGGVGRSTALAMLAWHLSKQGKSVLVVDLDLESPGVGHSLLPFDDDADAPIIRDWPEFGVVDWLVEDLVGQADSLLAEGDLWNRSPLSTTGDIWVVPAMGGQREQDYVGKLSRAYVDVPAVDGHGEYFGDRVARLLDSLEDRIEPDVVLLDSRAGVHDISSALLTRINATWSLLFAVDSRQTWEGLRILFRHWRRKPEALRRLRQRLLTIAALVPETEEWQTYRAGFQERAFDVFREIYDEVAPGADDKNLFTFALDDPEAPHSPIRIAQHQAYTLFAPLERKVQVDETKVAPAFGDFLREIDRLLGEAAE
jgi:hypothetical protein